MAFFSSDIIQKQLERFGEQVDIYRESEGSADSYGDKAPTWAKQTSEYVLFDKSGNLTELTIRHELSGRMKDVELIAYAKSDSAIQAGDYLDAAVNWFVLFVDSYGVGGNTVYKILFLKRYE